MQPPDKAEKRVPRLIDAASEKVGGQNKMARSIGYTRSEVSQWHTGKRACPVEAQALMAHIAGLDPQEVLAYALIERHAGTPKGEQLLTALGKGLLATSAAAFLSTYASAVWAGSHLIRCIERLNRKRYSY